MRTIRALRGWGADLRVAARRLRRSLPFTATAVLCLALGIGATTALYGLARTLFVPDPHLAEPERLVRAFVDWEEGLDYGAWSYPDYRDVRDRTEAFAGFAVETPTPLGLTVGGETRRLWGSVVSADYFEVLGVEMARGRGLDAGEEAGLGPARPVARPVTVLSDRLWRRVLGADPDAVGRTVTIGGRPFTVIGVAPPGFTGPNAALESALWIPVGTRRAGGDERELLEARAIHWLLFAYARLEPGVELEGAQASVDLVMSRLAEEHPDAEAGKRIWLIPEARAALHPQVRGGFLGFFGAVGAVVGLALLLLCSNLAALVLARVASLRRELGVRLVLGAGRARLIRVLSAESLLLAVLGTGGGLLLAVVFVRVLAAVELPVDAPVGVEPGLDPSVLVVAIGLGLLTVVLFGAAPALRTTRGLDARLDRWLRSGTASGSGGASRAHRLLVVAQITLTLTLLVGAGLLLRSLANARSLELGFEPDGQVVASLDAGMGGLDADQGRRFFRRLLRRVETLPGVEAAGYARLVPLSLQTYETPVLPEGYTPPSGSPGPMVSYNLVGPGYFEAMGIPRLAGETFRADEPDASGDPGGEPPPVIVNRSFAERFWPVELPVGKRVRVFGREHRLAGVVADSKIFSLGETVRPHLYLSLFDDYRGDRTLHVRVAGEPAGYFAAIRRHVEALGPTVPLYALDTMRGRLGFALLPARLGAAVAAAFAGLALFLSAMGLYGLLAFWVARRRRELGIRLALGATPRSVEGLVMRQAVGLVAAGGGLGLLAGLFLGRAVGRVLYDVGGADPVALLGGCAVLGAVALAASWLPARRAARTDPAETLRAEG